MGNILTCNKDLEAFRNQEVIRSLINIRGTFTELNKNEMTDIADDPNMKAEVYQLLKNYNQKHIVEYFPLLTIEDKNKLINQVSMINFGLMDMLFHQLIKLNKQIYDPKYSIQLDGQLERYPRQDHQYDAIYDNGLKAISVGKGNLISLRCAYFKKYIRKCGATRS